MDSPQARTLLRKINQLFDSVEHSPSGPSRIELDLLKDYTRQFYEALSESEQTEQRKEVVAPKPEPVATPTPSIERIEPHQFMEAHLPEPPIAPAPQPAAPRPMPPEPAPAPVRMAEPVPAPVRMPEPISSYSATMEAEPEEVVVKKPAPEVTPTKPNPSHSSSSDFSALFSSFEAKDLSDKLRLSHIDDLAKAMGINERFLTINELFKGDHEAFDRILRSLNNLNSFQEARSFLETEVIQQYGWLEEKKLKKAVVFIQHVQRRYH
ncbi:MAG: hypothetical protein KA479_12305 [Saprospiraceae bacterium]|nr:hypothetical protein [Saprospiraceae bacterium]